MAYVLDPVEYGRALEALKRLAEDVSRGDRTIGELKEKIESLEEKFVKNDNEHRNFVMHTELAGIQESLKKLENSVVVMTPKQAKDAGNNWFSILLKNPTYLMWLVLGTVVVSMVFMGYSFVEISQVLNRIN